MLRVGTAIVLLVVTMLATGHAVVPENVLMEVYNKGRTLANQGNYSHAVPYFQNALQLGEKKFGPNHPTTALLLIKLALLYQNLSRFDDAEALYKRSLRIYEEVLGPSHNKVAEGLDKLAALYKLQNREENAEPLYVRSLAIREKIFGKGHPDANASRDSLDLFRSKRLEILIQRNAELTVASTQFGSLKLSDEITSMLFRNMVAASKATMGQVVEKSDALPTLAGNIRRDKKTDKELVLSMAQKSLYAINLSVPRPAAPGRQTGTNATSGKGNFCPQSRGCVKTVF